MDKYEENWSATEGHFFPYSSFGKFWQIRQAEHHWGKITSKYVAQIFKWIIKANAPGLQPAWGIENKLLRSSYKRFLHWSGQGLRGWRISFHAHCTGTKQHSLSWAQLQSENSFYLAVLHFVWTQAISAKSSLTRLNKHKKGKQNWQIKQNIWIFYWQSWNVSFYFWLDHYWFFYFALRRQKFFHHIIFPFFRIVYLSPAQSCQGKQSLC